MSVLSRRQFVVGAGGLGLLTGCGRLPGQAPPQAGRIQRIGFFTGDSAESSAVRYTEPFRQGLRDLGWTEGQNISIEWRYGDGSDERLAAPMAELAGLPVDLMVVVSAVRFCSLAPCNPQ
ncbi:MAG TPA: hypothetical protein VE983_07715 [Solirubrobacteraceae bacterium]|nr:hypothetical protein [Solirubrobacteraceae bacterium]